MGGLGNLVCCSGVSQDLPSFRWHPSAQVTSLAVAASSLKSLRPRPAMCGPHLLRNLGQVWKARLPSAEVTTSKLSPSVRAGSTKSCHLGKRVSVKSNHTERNRSSGDLVFGLHCKEQSGTNVRRHTRQFSTFLAAHRSLLLCLRRLYLIVLLTSVSGAGEERRGFPAVQLAREGPAILRLCVQIIGHP